jgi:hypothetical protein
MISSFQVNVRDLARSEVLVAIKSVVFWDEYKVLCLLLTCSLCLLVDPEEGSGNFFRNVCNSIILLRHITEGTSIILLCVVYFATLSVAGPVVSTWGTRTPRVREGILGHT